MERHINLDIDADDKLLEQISYALSSMIRLRILKLSPKGLSLMEVANQLKMPISTVSFHAKILKDAGLINVTSNPSKRGNEKIVSQATSSIKMNLAPLMIEHANMATFNIPIGSYSTCHIVPSCGMADTDGIIVEDDIPGVFLLPQRFKAEIIWLTAGYLEYTVPTYSFKNKNIQGISFSLELCSEAPNYRNDWKSDITFWINDVELCTWQSPGDFGGRRGRLNPSYWSSSATQYGLLKNIRIDNNGTFLDSDRVSSTSLKNLQIGDAITIKIGIKEDAKHIGGINIFGSNFGDYAQGLIVRIDYI